MNLLLKNGKNQLSNNKLKKKNRGKIIKSMQIKSWINLYESIGNYQLKQPHANITKSKHKLQIQTPNWNASQRNAPSLPFITNFMPHVFVCECACVCANISIFTCGHLARLEQFSLINIRAAHTRVVVIALLLALRKKRKTGANKLRSCLQVQAMRQDQD